MTQGRLWRTAAVARVRTDFLGNIFEENLRRMEAEAEGRPEGPPEFVANFLKKCYPIKYVLTIDPVERLRGLGTNVSRRDALYWAIIGNSHNRENFFRLIAIIIFAEFRLIAVMNFKKDGY